MPVLKQQQNGFLTIFYALDIEQLNNKTLWLLDILGV